MAGPGQGIVKPLPPWNRWERLAGMILILALALLCEVLRGTPFRIANPPAFFIPAIVFAGFRGGLFPALVGAGAAWAYTAYYFSGPDLFRYSVENLNRVIIWGISMPLTAWMAGELHQRASRALAQAKVAEQEQERAKERAKAEEALRESEALLRTFVDHAADAFFLHDTDDFGKILDVNRQACESLGYSREELIGNYPREFDVGLSPEEVIRIGMRVAAGETFAFETRHRRKDGSEFPVEMRVRPFQHGGKRMSVALGRDITERKQAEKALSESHDLLRAVVEGTPDAILVKDMQGRYRMINTAGARGMGRTVEEVIGKTDGEIMAPEAAAVIRERELQILATGETETFEETVATSGGPRVFLTTKGIYRDRQGNVIGLIGLARDVTDLKKLETEFRQAQKMEALGGLAGGVAHDFNNLLMIITGYSELVFNRLRADDPSRGPLTEIQKAGERAVALTRQLLAFSRKQVLQPQVLRLNQLLDELISLLRRLIGEDIELTQALDPGLGLAKVDPGQFEQAIINLAVNARDAMPGGGRLSLATRNAKIGDADLEWHPDARLGRYVVVEVSDTGQGMDESVQARIFEPFFTTKAAGKGTGLGLAMVYGFVKQSGGHVEVESIPGRGTTFRLYLPRSEETESSRTPASEDFRIPKGEETILLVEDEEAVRTLARLVLQSYGYKVLEAADGQEGLAVAREYPGTIHMMVTDMVMPRMSGRQLADHLARERPRLPILFMSGYTDDAELQSGVTGAGEGFIPKPISPLALTRKVRQILDSAKVPRKVASLPDPA
jgi:two-component system cell cycle sensor histidine kinase/response regulator CckA